MTFRIGMLLGRDMGPDSVLPHVIRRLRDAGGSARVQIVRTDQRLDPYLFDADLVVLRALDPAGLAIAELIEEAGVRCCNSVAATARARSKAASVALLEAAGIPVPASSLAETWERVRLTAAGRSVVVKATQGSRGVGVLATEAGELSRHVLSMWGATADSKLSLNERQGFTTTTPS